MYCQNCGQKIDDENAKFCPSCGNAVGGQPRQETVTVEIQQNAGDNTNTGFDAKYNVSKAGIGVICCLFLGIIGLIIGIALYPENSIARKTFIKGWVITLIVTIVVSVFLSIFFAPMLLLLLEEMETYSIIL